MNKAQRIYAIGDIHGRSDLLQELLRRIEADNMVRDPAYRPKIVILGDMIDRGPDSKRLLRTFMVAQERNLNIECLMGNHEMALLDSLSGDGHAQAGWLDFGGLATLQSYAIDPPFPDEDPFAFADRLVRGIGIETVEWLRDRPVSFSSGDYFFCHAGVRPGVALARQSPDDLLWIREEFMESRRDHGSVVVHGHTVVESVEILPNRISVDTGAYRTGILSAIGLQGDQAWVVQTDPSKEFPRWEAPLQST